MLSTEISKYINTLHCIVHTQSFVNFKTYANS